MRKLKHGKRRRQRKQRAKRAITLTVEALEPRLVLSAAGFGFEGTRGQLDLHDRHHGNREANRPAFAEQVRDKRGHERFELAHHLEANLPKPVRDAHPRSGRPHQPVLANSPELGGHASRFNGQSVTPPVNLGGGEGESTVPTNAFEDFSSSEFVSDLFEPTLFAETTIPRTTVVFVSLTPATSPTRGNDSLSFGQSATQLTPPPRNVSTNTVNPQNGSAATLPVSVPVSSPESSRSSPTTPPLASPRIGFDLASSDSEPAAVQPAIESANIEAPGIETFVSSDLARWWNVDGGSFAAVFNTSDPLTESVRPAAAIGQAVAALTSAADNRLDRLSEESLWSSVSDGGFIEIDTDAADDTRERFEFAKDSSEVSDSKRLSTQTPRDAFWFDFGDPRFDLICDSFVAEELAEEQTRDDDVDATDEEAWLLDDGGMIVLTSSQFDDPSDEVAQVDDSESSSNAESAPAETEIPMDAGIGVFQAIEVAAAPVAPQDGAQPSPGEATTDADEAIPAGEQAAKNSDSGKSEPARAASMPLLLAIAAFMSRRRENRKKIADRQRKA